MEITRVVKRKNGGISISFIDDDGEQYGLLLRPEQIVANWKAAEQKMHPTLGESAASDGESKPAPKRVI